MINIIDKFIEAHAAAVTFALVFSIGMSLKFNGESVPQTVLRVITGFRFGFLKTTLATFVCTMFIMLYTWKGVISTVAFLIVLRCLWIVEYTFWSMDSINPKS